MTVCEQALEMLLITHLPGCCAESGVSELVSRG